MMGQINLSQWSINNLQVSIENNVNLLNIFNYVQKVTITITNNHALKTLCDLEAKGLIKIVKSSGFKSPAVAGEAMDIPAFEAWISDAENYPTVSLKDAKSRWANRKKWLR
jgi:hypothetical protein